LSAHEEAGTQALEEPAGAVEEGSLRLDKWLWYARFFKSRSLAARLTASGKIRRNRVSVHKAHQAVRPGDVLTFPQGSQIRVVKVLALGERRGPASEAHLLYEDLAPAPPSREEVARAASSGEREPGSGRPTKRERRAIDRLTEDG